MKLSLTSPITKENIDTHVATREREEAQTDHLAKKAMSNKVKVLVKPPNKLAVAQLKALITPLRQKEDGVMPKMKALLLVNPIKWEARGIISVKEEIVMVQGLRVLT